VRCALLEKVGSPLVIADVKTPEPKKGEVPIKVGACSLCRTDLHILDGELKPPKLPLILGHQVVGTTPDGQRVGVPWLGKACGHCPFCKRGEENLCDAPTFTGCTKDGGFAEYMVADEAFIFPLEGSQSDAQLAPLLCAGMIGYRSLGFTEGAKKLGFFGFGAAAHLLIQVALYQEREVFAFTRPGDVKTQAHAKKLGAVWAGGSDEPPPEDLDAVIIFAPVGDLVPQALKAVRKGGIVVCAGIHMSDIPSFPYDILWEERRLCSVANLTRKDGEEFLKLAAEIPIQTEVTEYPLEKINEAVEALREGKLQGSAVITLS